MEIGKNIKDYRNLRGMSQRELGKKINLTGQYISYLEKDSRANPSINVIQDISKALDVHIINLLGLEKEHKSIAKLTVDTKVNMTELEIAKAKLDQIKVLINEVNNMEIKLDVEANVRR